MFRTASHRPQAHSSAAIKARTELKPNTAFEPKLVAPFVVVALGALDVFVVPELVVPVAFVPLSVTARFWNAVKLRREVCTGLTAKTMPEPQCEEPSGLCWRQ